VTWDELQKIEQKLGFPLPPYYRATMLAYPFSNYEYTAKYFLAGNYKTVIKNNSQQIVIEEISSIFFVGGDPQGEQYFVDAAKVESPVYALDSKTGKYSIKAKTWVEFLDILRADIKDLEEEIAAERTQQAAAKTGRSLSHRQPNAQSGGNLWRKDLSPSIWPWLGPILGLLLLYGGLKAIFKEELRYRLWVYHGVTVIIGGIGMLLGAYLMFRAGVIIRKKAWNKLDMVVGIVAGTIFLGFLALRWIDVLR
jgi:hypothetical protein